MKEFHLPCLPVKTCSWGNGGLRCRRLSDTLAGDRLVDELWDLACHWEELLCAWWHMPPVAPPWLSGMRVTLSSRCILIIPRDTLVPPAIFSKVSSNTLTHNTMTHNTRNVWHTQLLRRLLLHQPNMSKSSPVPSVQPSIFRVNQSSPCKILVSILWHIDVHLRNLGLHIPCPGWEWCNIIYHSRVLRLSSGSDPANLHWPIGWNHSLEYVLWSPRLFHAPTRTTSSGCFMLHRTVHALWNLYGNPYRNRAETEEETIP